MRSDEKLYEDYALGDERAFEELVRRYQGPLFTVVLKMVRDRQTAEDIFQETFLRLAKDHAKFKTGHRLSPWLYTIATNLCRDQLRKRARSIEASLAEPPEPISPSNPEDDSAKTEAARALDAALASLPPDQKEIFLLREYSGMSFKEIASAKKIGLNTALSRMHLAMKKLRIELKEYMDNGEDHGQ